MKNVIALGFLSAATLCSCVESPRTTDIKPPSLVLGSQYIPEAFKVTMEAGRPLPLQEMKNIFTTHFDEINKVEVGMRWKTKQVSKVENDLGDICFRRTNGIKEVQKVENDKITISFDGTVEYLEGKNCWLTINSPETMIFTAQEDYQAIASIDEMEWDQFNVNEFSVGFYEQKETIKNSVTEGMTTYETFFPSRAPFFLYFMTSRSVETRNNNQKVLVSAEVNQEIK